MTSSSVVRRLRVRLRHGSLAAPRRALVGLTVLLAGASLTVPEVHALSITEIFYNPGPLEEGGPSLEYVEVFNDSSIVVDLSGAYFSDGIDFVFPRDTFLRARSYIAVCSKEATVRQRLMCENAIGDFEGRLDNGGERIRLVTATGSPLAEARYGDRGPWPAAADGTGFSLCKLKPLSDPSDPGSWTWSAQPGGTPGAENFPPPYDLDTTILPESGLEAVWRFRKGYDELAGQMAPFSSPPDSWILPEFDDASWPTGQLPIGYNEKEVETVLDDMLGRYAAFAVRRRVMLRAEDIAEPGSILLSVRIDDGFVAYWNGQEIGRSGLAGDPGTPVSFDALATSAREARTRPVVLTVPKAYVVPGEAVVAIQAHNVTLESNDAQLSVALLSRKTVVPSPPGEPSAVFNEIVSRAPRESRAVEIVNVLDVEVDLAGCTIANAATSPPVGFRFPAGSRLAPGAFVKVPETDLGFPLDVEEVSLFLYSAEGSRILDAVTVENPMAPPPEPQSHARFPDGTGAWWISTRPTAGDANEIDVETNLVINEVHYHPRLLGPEGRPLLDGDRGEFVEIHNRADRPIPLGGLRITGAIRHTFESGQVLEAGGYLVIGGDPAYLAATYQLPATAVLGPPPSATPEELRAFGRLGDGGDTIRIEDALGNVLDEVSYRDEGDWDELADGGGSSLELLDPRADNSRALAWGASDESARAPWVELSLEAPYSTNLVPMPMESELHIYLISEGECLIDDVSLQSGSPAVESLTNGGFETDTRPWRMTGTHIRSYRTTEEAKVGSASLRLVATGAGDNRVNRIEVDTSPALRAGTVRLRFWARWLRGSNALHVSGYNNAFGKTFWLPVPADTGSPGQENGLRRAIREATGSDGIGPVISEVRHEPAVPGDGQAVRILARIDDPDGVASARVRFQKDSTAPIDTAETVDLLDDGEHGDGRAGDGLYGGDLPGQPRTTLVNFRIEAADAGGRESLYPRKSAEHLPVYVVDDAMQSSVLRYRLVVNRRNMTTPQTGLATRLLHSDELVRGTFIFEESEVYYDVGLRYHGSPWNRPPDPKMFRVRFNGDRPFVDRAKRINLSRYGIAQNEGTAYHLLDRAGVPGATAPRAPRYQYLALRFNERNHGTVMAEIRPIDGEYAEFNWPDDANGLAWKITGKLAFNDAGQMQGSPDWSQLKAYAAGPYPGTASPENYRFYFNPALREDEDEFGPLIELLRTMDRTTTPDAEYDEKIQRILNVDASLRVFAVRSFLGDWDTVGIGNGQNAYLYYAPLEGRHYLVPWDMDHTFERTDVAIAPTGSTNGFGRLVARPTFKRLYAGILKQLLDSSWSEAHLKQWTDLVSETGTPGFVARADGLLSYLRTRRSQVTAFVKPGSGIPFEVTSPDPSGFHGPTGTLSGRAGIEVVSIFVSLGGGNVEPWRASPIWSPPPRQPTAIPTTWQISIDGLLPGANEVELFAFNAVGDLVGFESLQVHNTVSWPDPGVEAVSPAWGPLEGGTEITVRGTGFREPAAVLVGGVNATEVVVISEDEIRARTPPAAEGPVAVSVVLLDGRSASLENAFTYAVVPPRDFRRGDVDETGIVNQTDVLAVLSYLFRHEPLGCLDAADSNDDGRINVSDAIALILHLFQGGAPPPEPYDSPGPDPTPDALGCAPR